MRYCDECRAETRWLTAEEAAQAVKRSLRTIYYWIDEGHVHVRELPSGRGKRICENSLLKKPASKDE